MSDRRRVMSSSTRGEIGGHEYVDFGLPSGKKWATMNLGAINEYDPGIKYYWGYGGDGSGKGDEYKWYDRDTNILKPEYDNVVQIWGNGWRTPTLAEF